MRRSCNRPLPDGVSIYSHPARCPTSTVERDVIRTILQHQDTKDRSEVLSKCLEIETKARGQWNAARSTRRAGAPSPRSACLRTRPSGRGTGLPRRGPESASARDHTPPPDPCTLPRRPTHTRSKHHHVFSYILNCYVFIYRISEGSNCLLYTSDAADE